MTKRERAYEVLCEVLVNARNEAGLTQRQLAQKLGRAHTFIAKVELGERRLDVIEFIDLARALRVDPIELFARVVSR
jgi:transcriptional regulator with XRE-family HTH domain